MIRILPSRPGTTRLRGDLSFAGCSATPDVGECGGSLLLGVVLLVAACDGEQAGGDIVLVAGRPVEGYEDPASGISYAPSRSLGFGFAGEDITAPGPSNSVEAGEPVTITLQNDPITDGQPLRLHNFVVVAADAPNADEPLWGVGDHGHRSRGRRLGDVHPETPGTDYFVCSIKGHWGRGMFGEFIVEG